MTSWLLLGASLALDPRAAQECGENTTDTEILCQQQREPVPARGEGWGEGTDLG